MTDTPASKRGGKRRRTLSNETKAKISAGNKASVIARSKAGGDRSPASTTKQYRAEETAVETIVMEKVFTRWPQDDDELHAFVEAIWGFRIPRTRVCPNHNAPFEAFADAYFARSPVSIWEASRGFGGKSVMLAVLCLTEMLTFGCRVNILGGSGAQSQNVHRATDDAWAHPNAPRSMIDRSTTFDTTLHNGAALRSLTASETSVRGPHPLRLRLDEIDEMSLKILESAQGQPMKDRALPRLNTQTVMSSTHQHPDGTMTAMLKRAKESGWPIWKWCFRETSNPVDGWLTEDEIARKRQEVTAAMWRTEYDLQEPSFAGRAIDTAAVDAMFDPANGVFEGKEHEKCVLEHPGRYDNNRFAPYVTGVDWAKEQDYTVVGTYRTDQVPWVLVAWQRFRRVPWPNMVNRAQLQWRGYGGKFIHDATGLGNVVADILTVTPAERQQKVVIDQVLGGQARTSMFNEYIAAIENQHIIGPRIEFAYDEHRYATEEDLFGKGHPPDSFVSGALAWSLHPKLSQRINPVGSLPVLVGTRRSGWIGR